MRMDGEVLQGIIADLRRQLAERRSPRAYAPLAEAYRLRGNPDAAIHVAREGLATFPQHAAIRIVLARALIDAGARGDARAAYREVLSVDRENTEAKAALEMEVSTGTDARSPGAASLLQTSRAEIQPGSLTDELSHLADLLGAPGTGADSGANDALGGIATLTLAEIYARQGLFSRAMEVCERILEKDPGDSQAADRLQDYRRSLAQVS